MSDFYAQYIRKLRPQLSLWGKFGNFSKVSRKRYEKHCISLILRLCIQPDTQHTLIISRGSSTKDVKPFGMPA